MNFINLNHNENTNGWRNAYEVQVAAMEHERRLHQGSVQSNLEKAQNTSQARKERFAGTLAGIILESMDLTD